VLEVGSQTQRIRNLSKMNGTGQVAWWPCHSHKIHSRNALLLIALLYSIIRWFDSNVWGRWQCSRRGRGDKETKLSEAEGNYPSVLDEMRLCGKASWHSSRGQNHPLDFKGSASGLIIHKSNRCFSYQGWAWILLAHRHLPWNRSIGWSVECHTSTGAPAIQPWPNDRRTRRVLPKYLFLPGNDNIPPHILGYRPPLTWNEGRRKSLAKLIYRLPKPWRAMYTNCLLARAVFW